MKEPLISDSEGHDLLACILLQLGVTVPGPGAGMEVCQAIESVDAAIEKVKGKRAECALELYKDALVFVAGVWAHQQKRIIAKLEAGLAGGRQ